MRWKTVFEILPLAQSEHLGVITYSPLGCGLLTGKYGINHKPVQGRLIEQKMYADRYADQKYFEIADRFTTYCKEQHVHPATLALPGSCHILGLRRQLLGREI